MPVRLCPDGPVHCQLSPVPSPYASGRSRRANLLSRSSVPRRDGREVRAREPLHRHVCGSIPDAHDTREQAHHGMRARLGAFCNRSRRVNSICRICSRTSRNRSISRRDAAGVRWDRLSSGVRRAPRRSGAFLGFGLKPRMPSRTNAAFIRLTGRLHWPTRLSRSRSATGIFLCQRWNRHNLAMIPLAAQPAEKSAL